MRRLAAFVIIIVGVVMGMSAQVTNYSLRLDAGGTVQCGALPEMNGARSYTVQLWLNADQWTEGASVMSIGNDFDITLGATGKVNITVADALMTVSSSAFKAGNWSQITLVCDNGDARVLVDGTQCATTTFPAFLSTGIFVMGSSSFAGRIDDVRLWNGALSDEYNYFINNTLNKWCPQIDELVAYYKFDYDLCENVVDFKTLDSDGFNHHGIFSSTGARREAVSDNEGLRYLVNGAYVDNSRFYDRGIARDQYLLSNDLIILGIRSSSDGHLRYTTPCCHANITGGTYLSQYEGREGVLQLDGSGKITSTTDCFVPEIDANGVTSLGYTFETWIYLDEWTEGAYLFRKESEDGQHGFSISLGEEATQQVIVRCNGQRYVNQRSMKVGKWMHFAVTPFQGGNTRQTFMFVYDGVGKFATTSVSDSSTDYTPTGMENLTAYVGEGIKGKLDETAIWNRKFSESELQSHKNNMPMPSLGGVLTAEVIQKVSAFYRYDEPENLGYDSYSQDQWLRIMKSAYDGYRGYKVRISVASHTGWLKTIADASKRKIFAQDLARLSAPYDGVELDLEWADYDSDWANYGLLAEEIRSVLPEGKEFHISCHVYGAYRYPVNKMDLVDGFTFQQYGPGNAYFKWNNFTSSLNAVMNYGFPRNKIMLSYATTTSGPYDENDNRIGTAVTGVRNGLMDDPNYVPNPNEEKAFYNGCYYYFTGPLQTYRRAKHCVDNKLQGIFYWDMGNDVPVTHKYNLAKHCSYGLNANVDKIVTEVNVNHYATVETLHNDLATKSLSVNCYPNPAFDQLSVRCAEPMNVVNVYQADGVCVASNKVDGQAAEIKVSNLTPGMYVLTVECQDGSVRKTKFFKK